MFDFLKRIFRFSGKSSGYSMLELVLALAVGSIVIAGGYSSYVIISKQYQRITAFASVQEAGIPTIRLLTRDLRMAGRTALDGNIDPVFGIIATPINITDSGNACCDSVEIIYDKSSTERRKITYFVQAVDAERNAMYMDVDLWDSAGSAWVNSIDDALVTDYVEDFQLEGSDNDSSGNPMTVDICIIIRSRDPINKTMAYTRPDEVIGNYDFNFNDNYIRDEFIATVNIKNLR